MRKQEILMDMHATAYPWKFNPSGWAHRWKIVVLAMIASGISLYLGLYEWGVTSFAWDPVFGNQTEEVLKSEVSHMITEWIKLPDAILGSIAYFTEVIFALAGSTRRWQDRPWLVILFGLDVIPLGVTSAILVTMQGTVVGHWCFLCLCTACVSLTLVFLAYQEVLCTVIYLHRVWKKDRSLFWPTLWGTPSHTAYKIGLNMEND
jgi:hypothetical protein